MVGAAALHPAAAILGPAPEVAAAHNDAHLNALLHTALHRGADLFQNCEIQAGMFFPGQSLAADLQQDPMINSFAAQSFLSPIINDIA